MLAHITQHEGNNRKIFAAKNIYKNNQEFKVARNYTENCVQSYTDAIQSLIPGCIATSIMFHFLWIVVSAVLEARLRIAEFSPADTVVTEQPWLIVLFVPEGNSTSLKLLILRNNHTLQTLGRAVTQSKNTGKGPVDKVRSTVSGSQWQKWVEYLFDWKKSIKNNRE